MRSQHHTNQSHPHNLEVNRMGTHSWEGKQFVVSFCHLFFKSSPKNPFCPLQKNKNKNDHFQSLQSSTHIANPSQEGGRKKGERTGKDPMLTKETFFLIALFIPVPQKHLHSLTPLAVKITPSTPSHSHSSILHRPLGGIRQINKLCRRRIFSGCDLPKKQLILLEVKEESQPISDKHSGEAACWRARSLPPKPHSKRPRRTNILK